MGSVVSGCSWLWSAGSAAAAVPYWADLGRKEERRAGAALPSRRIAARSGKDLDEDAIASRGGDAAADQREQTSVGDAEAAFSVEALRGPALSGAGPFGQLPHEELRLVLGEGAAEGLVRHHATGSAHDQAATDERRTSKQA